MQRRYFTLDEANGLRPWLQEVFDGVAPLAARARLIEDELKELTRRSGGNGGGGLQEQIRQKHQDADEVGLQIRSAIQEVAELGIIVRGVENALVDFPSWREGREVYLCWVVGEAEVSYWHDTDTGFAGRQPL